VALAQRKSPITQVAGTPTAPRPHGH